MKLWIQTKKKKKTDLYCISGHTARKNLSFMHQCHVAAIFYQLTISGPLADGMESNTD